MPLNHYERKLYELLKGLTEQDPEGEESGHIDMSDPVMQKTGWWKDNPELTVGGVLKQGDKHPAYKDARDIVDKERGGESDEKPEPKQTKIAANPFDDEPEAKPAAQDEPEAKPAAADADLSDPKQMKQAIFKQYPDLAKMAKDPKTAGMVDKLFDPEYQAAAGKDLDTEPELPDFAQDLDPDEEPELPDSAQDLDPDEEPELPDSAQDLDPRVAMDRVYDTLAGDDEETENLLNPGGDDEEVNDAANTLNDRVKQAGHYKQSNAENLRKAVEDGEVSEETAKEIYTYMADPTDENWRAMGDEAEEAVMDHDILNTESEDLNWESLYSDEMDESIIQERIMNYYERKIYEVMKGLTEADKFYARDPKGKKISVFTDKDNYEKAVKGGYEAVDSAEAEAELAGQTGEKPAEKPEPKATDIAADPFADKGGEEPEIPDWYSDRGEQYEEWAHIGGIEPRSRTMSRDEMEASGIPMRELEQNYDSIPKDAGDAVVDSYEGYNQKTGGVVQMVVIRYEDGTTYYMETELHHHGTDAAWPEGEEFYDNRMKKVNQRSTKPDDYQSRGMAPKESAVQKSAAIHGVFGIEPLHGHDYTKPPEKKEESVKPFKSQYNRLFESIGKI